MAHNPISLRRGRAQLRQVSFDLRLLFRRAIPKLQALFVRLHRFIGPPPPPRTDFTPPTVTKKVLFKNAARFSPNFHIAAITAPQIQSVTGASIKLIDT